MSVRDDLLPVVWANRSLPGEYGLRLHAVAIVTETWRGPHTGEGDNFLEIVPILEQGGHPPKTRWLKDEEIAVASLPGGSVEIGPITPKFASGGTDLTDIVAELDRGATRHVLLTGPKHPSGAKYVITSIEVRPFHYTLKAIPVQGGTP